MLYSCNLKGNFPREKENEQKGLSFQFVFCRSWNLPQLKSDFSCLIGEIVRGRWPEGQKGILVLISDGGGSARDGTLGGRPGI